MDIDVVVMWVDGNDPEWIREKEKYSPMRSDDSDTVIRYRDWGVMKYWFRSIEKYMPWVRKVHFVTWGHIPDFLDADNPKLNIVKHDEFMDRAVLPCFNSSAIEMNIFRIPDLAEHFVFFNDDMFVTKPLSPDCFFVNDLPCQYYAEIPMIFEGAPRNFQMVTMNILRIINNHFEKRKCFKKHRKKYISPKYPLADNIRSIFLRLFNPYFMTGFRNYHMPAPLLKATFKEIWEKEPEVLEALASHRFRDAADVNHWLALWWQLMSGSFVPKKNHCRYYEISIHTIDQICEAITKGEYEMICINDADSQLDYNYLSKRIQAAFEEKLPQKSSFEV